MGGGSTPAGTGGAPGQQPATGLATLNPSQRNYVINQGKMLPSMGGAALTGAQQNFVNNNWLPKPQTGSNGWNPAGSQTNDQPAWFTGGTPLLGGAPQSNDLMQAFQQMFGGGGGYGNNYLY
jgi:hypothetical protein